MSIFPLSQAHTEFELAVSLMPTGYIKFLFMPCLESSDLVLNERTLYIPVDSDNAILALKSDQIGFFKILDRVLSSPIDSIIIWTTTEYEYRPSRFFHPLYYARNKVYPEEAIKQLGCNVMQIKDYLAWFELKKNAFVTGYVEELYDCDIADYLEILGDYIESKTGFVKD